MTAPKIMRMAISRMQGDRMKKSSIPEKKDRISTAEAGKEALLPTHYVAVGASAGGLEAIEAFFSGMPLDSGLGFVVIQHLSPDYKSLMVELLSKKTRIPVQRIEDGMEVLANRIYLIPPKTNLTLFHGKLLLGEQDFSRGVNLPIDVFMRSLADDQGEKAIGVILSGTGSDGMRGVRAIKEFGGMVMVQDENTAKFNGMPRSAISTGLADFVLGPEDMAAQLVSFVQHPYMSKDERSETLLHEEDKLTRIYAILRERCKLDFTDYKPSTVIRRIERRMNVNHVDELDDYIVFLQNSQGEAGALYRELLIGVTRFFRDTEVFDKLAGEILPELFSEAGREEMRFWVAACSTGEEAYTLAILVQECQEKLGKPLNIKIFATDIDREALQYAANGLYPESIAADISPRLLSKYFLKKDDNFQIIRKVREMVVFAQHNLIKDPPFTNITLVSCRNLLIYFQSILQRKVLEFFNFSINQKGILLLGTSETTGDMSDYFETVDNKLKIYRSKGRIKPLNSAQVVLSPADTRARDLGNRRGGIRQMSRPSEDDMVLERYLEALTQHFIPLAIIVNEHMEVLRIMGDTEGYFKLPSGKLVNDITKMAAKNLSIPLTTGISKAFRQRQEVRFSNIAMPLAGSQRLVEVRVVPLPEKKEHVPLVAVFISEMKKEDTGENRPDYQAFDLSREAEEHFKDLEQELQFTRENLQATIEELETSNEELQATNEELLASNEELQSTNEELQSTNEELFTVNSEYQSKIIELTELHNDVENLMTTSQIGQILLDENLEVRRFSQRIGAIFKILNTDIGRPITHILHNLVDIDLFSIIEQVQQTCSALELEVRSEDKHWYVMKAVPYTIGPKEVSGTVLSFVDITQSKEAGEALQASNQKFRTLFETLTQGVVYYASSGKITAANPAAEKILGLSLEEMKGRLATDPRWQAVREDGSPLAEEEHPVVLALKIGKAVRGGFMGIFNPLKQQTVWINISAVPQFRPGETRPNEVHATFSDVTELKRALQLLKENEGYYSQLFEEMPGAFALHDILRDDQGRPEDYLFVRVNHLFEELTGQHAGNIIQKKVSEVFPSSSRAWVKPFARVAQSGEALNFESYDRESGRYFDVRVLRNETGQIVSMIQEITRQKNLEKELAALKEAPGSSGDLSPAPFLKG